MDQMFPAWLALHGHGPLLQATLIVLGTFILEDAATILAAMDVQIGQVGLTLGLSALYLGIVLGDIGLYGLGRFTATAIVATLIWTSLLFSVSLHIGRMLTEYLGAWRWIGMAGFALTVVLMTHLLARLRNIPA